MTGRAMAKAEAAKAAKAVKAMARKAEAKAGDKEGNICSVTYLLALSYT